jgi:lipopolysaccharide transport system ATP-binding protein
MTAVIHVESLGKRYRIGHARGRVMLRDRLTDVLTTPVRLLQRGKARDKRSSGDIWALRDVSFDVNEGEILGLIGRNGAGKSTLLKVLSRITEPTVGWAEIQGRMGSLLEVGTGFHPELTGRENVFFNGAILGMSKAETERKFDEIVAFAEVEKFIDTPVKHYSSGMYVRLAFAVAAHLETEILFVDEVLAVGDVSFQKKCLSKMGEVSRGGRTVVFVSHNMNAISALCSRAVILDHGEITFDGSAEAAMIRYSAENLRWEGSGGDLSTRPRQGNGKARFRKIGVEPLNSRGETVEFAYPGCDLRLSIDVECKTDFEGCILAAIIYDAGGYRIVDTNTSQKGEYVSLCAGQNARATFLLQELLLKPGNYLIGLWLGRHGMEELDHIEYAVAFDVLGSEETSRSVVTYPGVYLCRFESRIDVLVDTDT